VANAALYRRTQVGWKLLAGTAVGLALATWVTLSLSPATRAAVPWMIYAMYATLLAAVALFATLTVEVDEREIRLRFGIGLIRRTIELADVLRTERVRIKAWWGWGLHWTPTGWLYNIGGRDAVRIAVRRDRGVVIGSDDAERLQACIDARLAPREA
jgi:hypothetical protein